MPWTVTFSNPTSIYTITLTMPRTTPTRRRTTEDRVFSAPVITGLFSGFTAMLAGLAIELQGLPCCFESTLALVTIVTNNLWAAREIVSPVSSSGAVQLFRCTFSSVNLGTLFMMMVLRASRPAQGEVSLLSIIGIFMLEFLGLLAVGVAATLSHLNDEEAALIENANPAEDASPVEAVPPVEQVSPAEEAPSAEETFPDDETTLVDEVPEEVLTPEQCMQRSLELLERADTLVNNFGVSVHQLTWYADVLRGTAQEINRAFAWGWDPQYQRQEVPDEEYPENDNDTGFLAAYCEGLARQGHHGDPNQAAEDESGYYDDYVEEEENDSEFSDEDQYSDETDDELSRRIAEEIEWAMESAHVVQSEDVDSDASSMPDLIADGDLVML